MTLNIALLGAGRIGKVHAKAVAAQPSARLVAVHDASAEAAQALAAAHGCARRSLEEILADPAIGAVLICTPTDTHADLIERFTAAGKAVFCEKPVDLNIDRVRACLKAVEAVGGKLMIGFNRRFDPHFAAVKAAIEAGKIGEVEMATITSRDPGLPHLDYLPRSGGIFRDMTIHDFDMARHLLGEEIATVQASAAALVDPRVAELGDFDSASVILATASGRQALISNSRRASYGYDQRIEVHGSEGMISAENQRAYDIELATKAGYLRPPLQDFFMTRYAAAYEAEIAAFIRMAVEGAAPSPSGHDGLKALEIAEAALLSVKEGRAVAI
ncbi:inositol 2-dehydrogenase [Neomegalonema perideroedes]|uniref:inositol 2-dehydrogenase n=1 Tax=Neomegalonema perideroedes TaxID=217219 RepID=UPI000380E062|nr:inositol 2-dehydrogenase [Neomegalonema perideroedes]